MNDTPEHSSRRTARMTVNGHKVMVREVQPDRWEVFVKISGKWSSGAVDNTTRDAALRAIGE